MTVRLYRSTDASAPTLNGQAGSLTAVLDACLVNGYGTQTAAGWSIAQTTTNKRAYKQGAGGSHPTGVCCYIDDTGPGGAGAREARWCGFETMSAITPVGTGQFPNSTQTTVGGGYLVIRKSNTNDSTARKWYVVADAWTFYLFIEPGDDVAPLLAGTGVMFGDFESYKSGDAYCQMIIGRMVENSSSSLADIIAQIPGPTGFSVNNAMPGHFVSRHWNQLTVSVKAGKVTDCSRNLGSSSNWGGDNGTQAVEGYAGPGAAWNNTLLNPYPNPVDGALSMAPFYVVQNGIRGYLKGLWNPLHHMPLNPGDTFTAASGNLSGKSFIAVNGTNGVPGGPARRPCQFFIEFSDTWP